MLCDAFSDDLPGLPASDGDAAENCFSDSRPLTAESQITLHNVRDDSRLAECFKRVILLLRSLHPWSPVQPVALRCSFQFLPGVVVRPYIEDWQLNR